MIKSLMFPLMIDKDTEFLLNLTVQWAIKQPGYMSDVTHFNLLDALESLKNTMQAGLKEVEWCNHPDCRNKEVAGCNHKEEV